MRRAILALAMSALLIPATASAATDVTATDQQWLAAHGFQAADDDAFVPLYSITSLVGDCPDSHTHTRRRGAKIANSAGNAAARVGVKAQVCAGNGRIQKFAMDFRHASPGRSWYQSLPPQHIMERVGDGQVRFVGKVCFKFGTGYMSEFSTWQIGVQIRMGVVKGTDHQVWDWSHRWVSSSAC